MTNNNPTQPGIQSKLSSLKLDPFVLIIGLIVVGIDQLTKSLAVQSIGPGSAVRSIEVVGDFIRFTYVTNTGAAFGLFSERTSILTMLSLLAVPLLLFAPNYIDARSRVVRLCVGLLFGGALGNLIDRATQGFVVDFVDIGIGSLRWYVFNVADASFVIGVTLLAAYLIFWPESEPQTDTEPESQSRAAGGTPAQG